jgi:hypothetical protein
MSNLARIILIGNPFIGMERMEVVNNYLSEKHLGIFKQVDQYADGGRPFVEDVWMGCFNYLPLEDFLNFLVKHARFECTIVVHREHDDKYWMCQCEKEFLPVILPETGI